MKLKDSKNAILAAGAAASTVGATLASSLTVFATETTDASSTDASTSDASGDMPSGDAPSGDAPSGDAPSGDAPSGEAPSGDAPDGEAPSGGAPGGGSSSAVTEWSSVYNFTSDTTEDDGTYESTGTDENAILVSDGATVTLNNPTITKTSDDSTGGDNSSFYGVGAAVLTTDGTTIINGGEITTDSAGGAGVFSYDSGVTYIANTTINTTQDTSGGLHVAGGGTLYAWNVTATTNGESSAAIRSDRGGGTMVVDGGTYTSNGTGSPAVYVTADISIKDATLTANGSEGICIEGLNTLRLFNCDLTSSMPDNDQNDCTWSVILYQSMSGDSEVGNSSFYMVDGSITSTNGGLFYSTNTESDFYLENVTITASDDCEFFLKVTGNQNERGWGTVGENGADTDFTAVNQVMSGDVIWDSVSNLDFYITEGSSLTGAIIDDETNAGDGGDGYCSVYIDSTSTWIVTGDSTVTNLYSEGTITDEEGNTVTIEDSDGTIYVEGTSEYTITVEEYSEEVDLSGVLTAPSWEDYEVEAPSALDVSTDTTSDSSDTESTTEETTSDSSVTEATVEEAESTATEAKSTSTGLIIGIVVVAALVIGAVVAVFNKKN